MTVTLRSILKLSIVATVAIFATACSEDSTPTPTPPVLDAQFIGYSDPLTKQTTCGNCHVEKQAAWETTKHASAWNGLQASGHAETFCEPCHTTGGYGNAQPDSAGFVAVDSAAKEYYYDVQCEACHGPGAAHVSGPETVQPISTIKADTGATEGCATCHNGSHHPFVEEWRMTRHGIPNPYMNTNPSCVRCHEGRGAINVLDPGTVYQEQAAGTPPQALVCAVCHDPHGSDNPADMRRSLSERDPANNMCMTCHLYRTAPTTGSSRSNMPHGPQGGVLIGVAGWMPPGFTYDTSLIETSHGSSLNPTLCAGCHVVGYSVNDAASGNFLMNATGHRFLAIPCVDVNGAPDSAQACGHDVAGLGQRRFAGCAVSGCHASENAARGAFSAAKSRMDLYLNTLWIDVDGDKTIDAFPTDSGLLPKVKQLVPTGTTSCTPSDTTVSVCDGAEFNTRMFGGHIRHDHPDGSYGTHNPFYYEALLIATINTVRSTYGLPAPPAERTAFAARMAALGMTR